MLIHRSQTLAHVSHRSYNDNEMYTTDHSLATLLSLKGKTALITGAAMGIGEAISHRYAEAGANLYLLDINQPALEAVAGRIADRYRVAATPYVADLGDSQAIVNTWAQFAVQPDVLVNNAGIFRPQKLTEISDNDFGKMMNVNTRGVIMMCREMIKRRGDNPGTIVNISSIEAVRGMTYDMLLYGTSKAAVLAVTRGLVKDYARKGWKINTILPGGVKTPGATAMGVTALKHFDLSILKTSITFAMRMPTKGMGQPDDIARAALWLGTPMSDYMNGAEVAVDGGFLAV